MALRITKAERQQLNQQNARVRQKQNRIYNTFGIKPTFKTMTAKEFTTRKQFNEYKFTLRKYLNRSYGNYVKGGTYVKTIGYNEKGEEIQRQFAYPIERSFVRKVKREFARHNRYVDKQWKLFEMQTFSVKLRPQQITVKDRINTARRLDEYSISTLEKYGSYRHLKFDPKKISSKRNEQNLEYVIKKFQSPESLFHKQQIYKENYKSALFNTFGSNALPLTELINDLDVNNFLNWVESEEFIEIGYIYDPEQAYEVLQYLTQSLLDYIDMHNIQTTEYNVEIAENLTKIDSSTLLREYGKGSLGGQRIVYQQGKTWYYTDISPEEAQALQTNKLTIDEIISWNERRKQLPRQRTRFKK